MDSYGISVLYDIFYPAGFTARSFGVAYNDHNDGICQRHSPASNKQEEKQRHIHGLPTSERASKRNP